MVRNSKQDNLARRLLIEQTKKETLNSIKQYVVGRIINGEFMVRKNISLNGWVIILSDNEYKELFEEKKE